MASKYLASLPYDSGEVKGMTMYNNMLIMACANGVFAMRMPPYDVHVGEWTYEVERLVGRE